MIDEAMPSGRRECLSAITWKLAYEGRRHRTVCCTGDRQQGDRERAGDGEPGAHLFTSRAHRFSSTRSTTGSDVTARVKWNAPAANTRAPGPVS